MKPKMLYAILAVVIVEALIIWLNILFGEDLPTEVTVLNIIVCTIAFASFAWPLFVKWDRSDDKVGRWVGTLGINMNGMFLYALLALAAMVLMNLHAVVDNVFDTYPVPFKYQLMVQAFLLLILIFSRFTGMAVGDQVEEVAQKEEALTSGLDDMKSAVRRLQDAVFICEEVDPGLRTLVDEIQQNIRYLSPVKSREARDIEGDFVDRVNALLPAFINYKMNEDTIAKQIRMLKHLVDNRKSIYN